MQVNEVTHCDARGSHRGKGDVATAVTTLLVGWCGCGVKGGVVTVTATAINITGTTFSYSFNSNNRSWRESNSCSSMCMRDSRRGKLQAREFTLECSIHTDRPSTTLKKLLANCG